jgi:cell division protein FtsQ
MDQSTFNQSVKRLVYASAFFGVTLLVVNFVNRREAAAVEGIVAHIEPLPDGNFLFTKEDVPKLLESRFEQPLTAMSLAQVDVERLERVLEEVPFIKEADAYLDAKGQVHLNLVQREPLLRVMDNNGLDYYLDRSGERMPPSEHYAARVLVATGNLPPHTPDFRQRARSLLKDVFDLAEMIHQDEFLRALIEQIYVNNKGEMVLAPKVGSQIIQFGRIRDAAEKLQRLKVFYREGLPYSGWDQYRAFDLRYKGQVVAKKH